MRGRMPKVILSKSTTIQQNVFLLLLHFFLVFQDATCLNNTLTTTPSPPPASTIITCRGSTKLEHLTGQCMFHYECVQRKGASIGPCFANHIVGSCCLLVGSGVAGSLSRADDGGHQSAPSLLLPQLLIESKRISSASNSNRNKLTAEENREKSTTPMPIIPSTTTPQMSTTRSQLLLVQQTETQTMATTVTPTTTTETATTNRLPASVNSIILSKLRPGTGIVVKDDTQFYEIISSNTRKTTTTDAPKELLNTETVAVAPAATTLTTTAANVTKSGALVELSPSTNGFFLEPTSAHALAVQGGTSGGPVAVGSVWFQPGPIPGPTPGHATIPNIHVEDIFSNHFPVALPPPSNSILTPSSTPLPPVIINPHYPTLGSLPVSTTPVPPPPAPVAHPSVVIHPQQPAPPPVQSTPAISHHPQDISNPGKHTCGIRPLRPTGRVVGGRNAAFGEWPWQVLIKEAGWLGLFMKPKCGGVLIDDRWVLTAAHCQPGVMGSLIVMLGQHESNPDNQAMKPLVKTVRRMIVHRDYNPETFDNDIALLELDTPFEIKPHVVPICLPETDYHLVGEFAHVAGFGKLSYESRLATVLKFPFKLGGQMPSILQTVRLPIIANDQCQKMFADAGHFKFIRDSFLCAGYIQGGKDTCEGDSGGPLMMERNGVWTLIGTVSHGIKCAEPNMPGVYMKTYAYLNWIKGIIGRK